MSLSQLSEQLSVTTAAWERAVKCSASTLALAKSIEAAVRASAAAAEAAAAVYREALNEEEEKRLSMETAKAAVAAAAPFIPKGPPPTLMEWVEMDEEEQYDWLCHHCGNPAIAGCAVPGFACTLTCSAAMNED